MKNMKWKKYAGAAMAAAMIPALVAPIATEAANSETVDLTSQGYSIANADGFDSDGVAVFYYDNHDRNLQDIDLKGGSLADTLNKVIDDRNKPENSTYGFSDTVTVSGASSTGILGGVPNEWVETDHYMLEIRHGGKIYEIPFRIKPGSN